MAWQRKQAYKKVDPGMAYVWMFRLPQGNNDIIENVCLATGFSRQRPAISTACGFVCT